MTNSSRSDERAAAQPPLTNGRQTPRLVPTTEVVVRLDGSDIELALYDLSLGGFAVVCGRPFAHGMTHRFMFSAPAENVSVTLIAKAIHSRALTTPDALRFLTGWEFMAARSETDRGHINRLFQAATRPHAAD